LVQTFSESDDARFLSKPDSPKFCPFIPRMRYVQVALATDGTVDGKPGGENSLFLLEEVINSETEGEFRKYINNKSAVPTDFKDARFISRAEFLAFTQHYQYICTHGLVFVSDYQGGTTLLTDPQLMSDPSLGNIFGNGNLPDACDSFKSEHECNLYCRFF
ncbi:hypothetical protein B0H15DRAFT_757061, partial [Mycena belliarum]